MIDYFLYAAHNYLLADEVVVDRNYLMLDIFAYYYYYLHRMQDQAEEVVAYDDVCSDELVMAVVEEALFPMMVLDMVVDSLWKDMNRKDDEYYWKEEALSRHHNRYLRPA